MPKIPIYNFIHVQSRVNAINLYYSKILPLVNMERFLRKVLKFFGNCSSPFDFNLKSPTQISHSHDVPSQTIMLEYSFSQDLQ